jgi:hypothetical protein
VNPDVGAAAALNIERRGSEESDSHLGYAQDYDIRLGRRNKCRNGTPGCI